MSCELRIQTGWSLIPTTRPERVEAADELVVGDGVAVDDGVSVVVVEDDGLELCDGEAADVVGPFTPCVGWVGWVGCAWCVLGRPKAIAETDADSRVRLGSTWDATTTATATESARAAAPYERAESVRPRGGVGRRWRPEGEGRVRR